MTEGEGGTMAACPTCHQRLLRGKIEAGLIFRCPGCEGRAVAVAVLRRVMPHETLRSLWQGAKACRHAQGKPCPLCRRPMVETPLAAGTPPGLLDVCVGCQFVWFDPREFEQVPRRQHEPAPSLPVKAREAAALMELKSRQQRERQTDFGEEAPDEPWKWIPAILGLPVEHEVNPLCSRPWLTWALAALMAATFALTWRHLMSIVPEWGLVPAQFWRHGGLTLITSFLLHAGPMHLIGNVYFLLVFGDNVEDQLGRWRLDGTVRDGSLKRKRRQLAAPPSLALQASISP
mgnify:CR=1 FL=1